jgi:prolyl oligopeptidase PreP (S9A serine peptidase family)
MFDKDGDGIIDFIDPDGGSGSGGDYVEEGCADVEEELEEIKSAFNTVKSELNEVNLLNSKLLYVNRIFKANTLDDAQKLRVVETLDKADSTKEAKLIYETIKDSFSIAKTKNVSKRTTRKPIKENFRKGIASKASGISRSKKTAPKRAIISESDNMVNRFQKLANIKINE